MRRLGVCVLAVLTVASRPVLAQDVGDTNPQAAVLRQQIETRFAQQIQATLGLSDEQTVKLRSTFNTYAPKRRAMEQEERGIKRGLQGQLRPGIAANSDSVGKLVDRLLELKVAYARSFVEEDREMAKFLTPVQRAQYQMLRERLMARIEEVRQQRQREQAGPGGPPPRP